MDDFKLFESDWGNMIFSVCIGKIDILPRITVAAVPRAFFVNIGFAFFSLNITIWDEATRRFNQNNSRGSTTNSV